MTQQREFVKNNQIQTSQQKQKQQRRGLAGGVSLFSDSSANTRS